MKLRPVGLVSLLALGVNGIVGVGIFFVPADLARRPPGMGSVVVFGATALALSALAVFAVGLLLSPAPAAAPALFRPSASWLAAGLVAMFALQGFEIVPVIAGHVRSPARAIPVATIGSLALAAVLYVILQAACIRALPGLAASRAPLAETAAVLGGPLLFRAVAAGTTVSALGIAFAMMVTTPRYLSALAEGGRVALGLDSMSARGVPSRALLVTWALVVLLLQSGSRAELFALSSV